MMGIVGKLKKYLPYLRSINSNAILLGSGHQVCVLGSVVWVRYRLSTLTVGIIICPWYDAEVLGVSTIDEITFVFKY